jgi:hypothetical protein
LQLSGCRGKRLKGFKELTYARLQGRREIISHMFSSSSPLYSLIEKSLPHTVQRMVTVRQPKWSAASLPQAMHVMS